MDSRLLSKKELSLYAEVKDLEREKKVLQDYVSSLERYIHLSCTTPEEEYLKWYEANKHK